MTEHSFTALSVDRDERVTTVWLDRPEVHNAFDARLIEEMTRVFTLLNDDPQTRVVVLAGRGKNFCAGADINWMRDSINFSRQQNVEDATSLARMLDAIANCSKPVVCAVQGLAIGGGVGLVCASDYVIATDDAQFALSEVKLGIVPAAISPFVLNRIGPGQARALFITGERIGCERALNMGLVHVAVPADQLQQEVGRVASELLTAAPEAITVAKRLINEVSYKSPQESLDTTVETIATKRTDPEGQDGLTAFLERRKPNWLTEQQSAAWPTTSGSTT